MGNALVPIAMYGWIPVVIYLFSRFPAQRALVISFVAAWLFLPNAIIEFKGLPDYTRMSATCYGVMLATIIFDFERIKSFRFSWFDIPMIVFCLVPYIPTAIYNLGPFYAPFSAVLTQTVTWGFPYFLGRLYLGNFSGLRQLAIGTFIGGLIYIPFCLYEARMSVNIHGLVYDFIPGSANFLISLRYGGYRPAVFMESGLMLGVWMMLATLIGIILWRARTIKTVLGIPISWLVAPLFVTFVIVKATGAYLLLLLALVILFTAYYWRTALIVWAIIIGMVVYVSLGASGEFPRQEVSAVLYQTFPEDRAQSVDFRFMNEELLSAKAREKAIFGWGGFGGNRIYNEYGEDVSVTDSLWIIVYGTSGIIGLVSIFTALALPVMRFCVRYPARLWLHPIVAPAAALAVGLLMYSLDCILNAMINPIFALISGGLSGLLIVNHPKRTKTFAHNS